MSAGQPPFGQPPVAQPQGGQPQGGQAQAGRPVAGRPAEADGQWHRVHPLSPALRFWQVLVVVFLVGIQEWGQGVARGEHPLLPVGGRDGSGGGLLAGGGIALAVIVLGGGYAFLAWRMTTFRITEESVELNHGVLFRRHRRARLDRLQAVDLVQPLVARMVGLARLNLDVAGGHEAKIDLSFLTEAQAQRLRNHLLARAAGLRYDTPEAPEAPEHYVLEVPVPRLAVALLLSAPSVTVIVFVVGLVVATVLTRTPAPVAGGLPLVIAPISLLWQRFTGGFAFRASTSPDGLRLRHGLLEHRAQTVPPGRVQAVRISQPLLWRGNDWWRVRVNVAGYGQHRDQARDTEHTLLPVGSRNEALTVLAFVLPDLGVHPPQQARAVLDAALAGSGPAAGFVTSPRSARWIDPLTWRRNGYRATEQALLIRRGWLHRHLDVVPHARTQSVGVTQGPVQRRCAVASVAVHSTPGPIVPEVLHLALPDAAVLLAEQSRRSHQARLTAGPERWMEAHPGTSGVAGASGASGAAG